MQILIKFNGSVAYEIWRKTLEVCLDWTSLCYMISLGFCICITEVNIVIESHRHLSEVETECCIILIQYLLCLILLLIVMGTLLQNLCIFESLPQVIYHRLNYVEIVSLCLIIISKTKVTCNQTTYQTNQTRVRQISRILILWFLDWTTARFLCSITLTREDVIHWFAAISHIQEE